MNGSFFAGFSGVLLPYTILYTRARDGAALRPTGFFCGTPHGIQITNPKTFRFCIYYSMVQNFCVVPCDNPIAWYRIFLLYHGMKYDLSVHANK
jgi:hypothetical protein